MAAIAMLSIAWVAVPEQNAPSASKVLLSGQAIVLQGGSLPELRIKAHATDGSGWLLEAALLPVRQTFSRGEEEENDDDEGRERRGVVASRGIFLDGTFTLGQEGQPLLKGEANGQISQGDALQLKLLNASGLGVLSVSVKVQPNGSAVGQLEGSLPPLLEPVTALTDGVGRANVVADGVGSGYSPVAATPVSRTFWNISRTAAVVSYLLLFANVWLGVALSFKGQPGLIVKWRAFDMHQFTALLAMGFVALHVFSLLGDHYFDFGMKELLLPFASPYRPGWTTLGVLSLYAVVMVTFSFYVRQYIGMKAWRVTHYISFALFITVLVHGLMAGSDTSAPWMQAIYVTTGVTVAGLLLWRFLGSGWTELPLARQSTLHKRRVSHLG